MRNRTQLIINLDFLKSNFELLKNNCPDNEIIFMVKANAYGHGAVQIVRYSVLELGIKEFGVASIGEALELRKELPDLQFEIYVFSDLDLELSTSKEQYLHHRIVPVLSSIEDLNIVLQDSDYKNLPLMIKYNTGMNRLGFSFDDDEIIKLIKSSCRNEISHLMTHLGSSFLLTNEAKEDNEKQIERFSALKKRYTDAGIKVVNSSISNSGAIEQGLGLEETHIRPGLMLYGPSSIREIPGQTGSWNGKTISRLESNILKVFEVNKDSKIGYGATTVPEDGFIALLAIGYGDGFSCRYKSPEIPFRGVQCQILGRINMDMTQIFIPKSVKGKIQAGETIQIWGHGSDDIINLSHQTNTIPYEHFCQLTSRVPRIYGLE
jgi:alanine racemase